MQIAIRRVLPAARHQLSRPQRLGLPLSTHLRIRARTRCFSQTSHILRPNDDSAAAIPIELTEGVERDVEASPVKEVTPKSAAEEEAAAAGEASLQASTLADEVGSVVVAASSGADGSPEPATRSVGRPPGSKGRRLTPMSKQKPIPKPNIPEWFTQRNVLLREHITASEMTIATGNILAADETSDQPTENELVAETQKVVEIEVETLAEAKPEENTPETVSAEESKPVTEKAQRKRTKKVVAEASSETPAIEMPAAPETTAEEVKPEVGEMPVPELEGAYRIHETVWREIKSHVRTGLILPKAPHMDSLAANKSHCILHLPRKGGVYYLDALVDKIALEMGADLVRIDAQDVAEIAGDYLGDTQAAAESDLSSVGIRALGYDTQIPEPEQNPKDEPFDTIPEKEDETFTEDTDASRSDPFTSQSMPLTPDKFRFLPGKIQDMLRSGQILGGTITAQKVLLPLRLGPPKPPPERVNEKKMDTLLRYLISAAHDKRLKASGNAFQPADAPTLIHVRDYRELDNTVAGHALLKNLHAIVQSMRHEGGRILIIGTSSTEESLDTYSDHGVRVMQYQAEDANERTILIPPFRGYVVDTKFQQDRAARTREINIRHLRDVIRRRSGVNADSAALVVSDNWHLEASADADSIIPEISTNVWEFDRVHRVATIALGERPITHHALTIEDIASAAKLIDSSDSLKCSWMAQEHKSLEARIEQENAAANESKPKNAPKEYTKHERKFLSRVVNPADIKTTFASVRAPAETIESMKILTSMSLVRPEAFKYGVLATDRIPGVLLYGPPGTGKTLLARAVAKESGATVLEISGADIEDMYVGESEKNVKAVFSLAKKLSPCVLFIDEADAIFNSRQDSTARSNRRETINQFLKEWADMSETAFIMLATNRPFDLDDAVLRRLPRRLLIDLPTAEDRLAILKLHLAAETLATDVDLKKIADTTQLYSGSDIKNICVSAALACVREENSEFEKTGKYPERRTLAKHHFEKAMKEVTPSISDDMKSLAQIRTFDEKYGERAGKRKPKKSWGFEQGQDATVRRGEGRVRME